MDQLEKSVTISDIATRLIPVATTNFFRISVLFGIIRNSLGGSDPAHPAKARPKV